MAARSKGWRYQNRRGKRVLIIDFYYLDKNGRRRRHRADATVQTATATAAEARRLMAFAAEHGYVKAEAPQPEAAAALTFAQYVETTFTEKFLPTYKPSTARRYRDLFRQWVLEHLGTIPLTELDANRFREFALVLGRAGVQLKGPLTLVRTVLRAAVSTGDLKELPVLPALVKQSKKLPKGPVRKEVDELFALCPLWLQTAVGLCAFTSLRSGEVRALEVRDLDLDARRIHVRRSLSDDVVTTTKGDAERWVPIPDLLVPILEEAKKRKLPQARLVLTPTGRTPTRQRLLSALHRVQEQNGLPTWTIHQLRHFFCSELVRNKVGIETVRVLAGHTHLQTTARYLHASDDDVRAAVLAFQPASESGQQVGNRAGTGSRK